MALKPKVTVDQNVSFPLTPFLNSIICDNKTDISLHICNEAFQNSQADVFSKTLVCHQCHAAHAQSCVTFLKSKNKTGRNHEFLYLKLWC